MNPSEMLKLLLLRCLKSKQKPEPVIPTAPNILVLNDPEDDDRNCEIIRLGRAIVFKKSSPNNKLTLYLASRDLVVENGSIDRIQGVLHVEPEYLENKKLYGQVTLTFRYGREDEEVMGLKFCNEAIMSLAQIWPLHCNHDREPNTPLQVNC
ncbi:phosrestin-1-like isoform X1 [Trichoplusia ni]|uniref:Phosrestin-1-like isoform X1 n=1 Tax=Trichoplusia ni TaxID=7111 RepID=A0A7E5WVI1_TRINI|nr:phosrestin-1-like isoform X1 [Trichoplusia ni]